MAIHSLLHRLNQCENAELPHWKSVVSFGVAISFWICAPIFPAGLERPRLEVDIHYRLPQNEGSDAGSTRKLLVGVRGQVWLETDPGQWIAVEPSNLRETLCRLPGWSGSGLRVVVQPDGQVSFQRVITVIDALLGARLPDYELA